jgi:hypothetical protein
MLVAHEELELKLTSHFKLELKFKDFLKKNYGIIFGIENSLVVHEELELRSHYGPKLELELLHVLLSYSRG